MLYIFGYKREAVEVIKAHGKLLRQFAHDCQNNEGKRDYFLKSYAILMEACNIGNEMWSSVQAMQSYTDLINVSLPIQRELAECKLDVVDLLLDMLEMHLNEICELNEANLSKDPILKAVSTYINVDTSSSNSSQNDAELKWRRLLAQLPELVAANLNCCFNFSLKIKHLKAQTLYLTGKSFRLLSQLKYQTRKLNPNGGGNGDDETELNIHKAITAWSSLIGDIIRGQCLSSMEMEAAAATAAKLSKTATKAKNTTSSLRVDSTTLSEEHSSGVQTGLGFTTRADSVVVDSNHLMSLVDLDQLRSLLISINQNEAQSMECLLQSLNLAFGVDDKELIANISYEFIEMIGCYDPALCGQFIALYQSSVNAMRIEQIVEKSSMDPKGSLITGYLHQLKHFKKLNTTRNALNSPVVAKMLEMTRSRFNAYKYLSPSATHFTLSKDLPTNYLLFIVQLNQRKNEMYITLLDRGKGSSAAAAATTSKGAGKGNNQSTSNAFSLKSMVSKAKYDPFRLAFLKSQWKEWRNDLLAFNSKLEFQVNSSSNNDTLNKKQQHHQQQQEKSTASPTKMDPETETASLLFDESNNRNFLSKFYLGPLSAKHEETLKLFHELNSRFTHLIEMSEKFLAPASEFLDNYFRAVQLEQAQQMQLMSNKQPQQPTTTTSAKPNDKLIVLADVDLFEFPLEALKMFHNNLNVCSVTRDFSLQFFATRYMNAKETTADNILGVKVDDKDKERAQKNASKAGGKQVNFENTDALLPDSAIVVEHGKLKYLVDTFGESSAGLPVDISFIGAFKRLCQQYTQYSAKWTGLTGNDHASSLGERERMLCEANCFLYHGPERFLSYFSSSKVASLNLNECKLLVANDLVRTSKSYSRLGKLEVHRHVDELECENALEAAILMSLTGVKCILANQWSSTSIEAYDRLKTLLKEFMENRQSAGELIRNRISPHVKQILADNVKREELKRQQQQQQAEKEKESKRKATVKGGGEAAKVTTKASAAVGDTNNKSSTIAITLNQESLIEDEEEQKQKQQQLEMELQKQRDIELEEERRAQVVAEMAKLRKENCNMICYGLPDLFMTN